MVPFVSCCFLLFAVTIFSISVDLVLSVDFSNIRVALSGEAFLVLVNGLDCGFSFCFLFLGSGVLVFLTEELERSASCISEESGFKLDKKGSSEDCLFF